jgi:glycosyltransferase involved in cell wall biosynthesis
MHSVSVVMATCNGGSFLNEQLNTLAIQSKLPSELIVVDDCSTDDTLSILNRFADHAPFPGYLHKNPYRKGYRQNFMDATALASSNLIAFCDQDDICDKDKLLLTSDRFADDSVLLVHHNANIVDVNGNIVDILSAKCTILSYSELPSSGPWAFSLGFTQLFHKKLLWFSHLWKQSVDRYLPMERRAHDQWFFFLAGIFGKIIYLDDKLASYRQHQNNLVGVGWILRHRKCNIFQNLPYIFKEDGQGYRNILAAANNRIMISII